MGWSADAPVSRERAPVSAYRTLVIGVAASLAFTLLIWLLGERLADIPHAADTGASRYYWKLIEPTTASRLTAWGFYLLHQVSFWALIAYAQRTAGRIRPRYTAIRCARPTTWPWGSTASSSCCTWCSPISGTTGWRRTYPSGARSGR